MEKIIIITGPSGVGKTTLGSLLVESSEQFVKVITATNRDPRNEEIDGKDYHFVTTEEFKQKIKEGFFIEHEEVYSGRFYGTPKIELENIWSNKKTPICIIDVIGAQSLAAIYGRNACVINIAYPNHDIAYERIYQRDGHVDPERFKKISQEEMFGEFIQSVKIINDNLEDAATEFIRYAHSFVFFPEQNT